MSGIYTIALAGNPNSGKTTMFNWLTGARQRVGNYPGVTVEKKIGTATLEGASLHIVDLPGTYSLTAYSQEELVARNFLVEDRPQVVVDILDATSLERNLYLAVQFLELGVPLVLVLNMMDEVARQGKRIDSARLSELMQVPVVETVARVGKGKQELLETAMEYAAQRKGGWDPLVISYGPDIDPVLEDMEARITVERFLTARYPARWVALKYLERDAEVMRLGAADQSALHLELEARADAVAAHCHKTLDTHPESIIADYRYGYIASILKQGVVIRSSVSDRIRLSDRMDRVLTQRLLGPAVMLAVVYFMFKATFTIGEIPMGWLEALFGWFGETATALIPAGLVQSLVVSGIIDGVGGVLGFVPLIFVMFLFLSFLEDLGYTARMAYMLDRVLRIFGLHGCSVMPFIVSGGIPGGCAVPGVMATRTLKSPKEKLATLLTAPFLTCGAKVPVFLLLAAAFFPGSAASVMFWITLGGWAMALLVARLLRSTVIRGESTPFVMELPPYRLPTLRGVFIHTWERSWQYIRKAGTVILAIAILIWAAMTFPGLPDERAAEFEARWAAVEAEFGTGLSEKQSAALEERLQAIDHAQAQAELKHSLAGRIGSGLEGLTRWAGFDWRTNIALVGGFAAKEVIVASLGTAYSLGEVDPEEPASLSQRLASDPMWTAVTALSLIVFVMLYAPCFVTVVAMARESSWRWALFATCFNTALAFIMAVVVYQVGTRLIT